MIDTFQKHTKELESVLSNKTAAVFLIFLVGLTLLPTQGFCDDPHGLNAMTDSVINTIFSPWVRKSILAFGAGLGVFQSIAGGSWKPLLTWGGLGLTVNYVPKIIDLLSK